MLPSGFEPESKPREGFMIGHYTTGAYGVANKEAFIKSFPQGHILIPFHCPVKKDIGGHKVHPCVEIVPLHQTAVHHHSHITNTRPISSSVLVGHPQFGPPHPSSDLGPGVRDHGGAGHIPLDHRP